MKFETKAVHAGVDPDPSTGAIMTPIFQTSTYVQEEPGKHKGYEYARTQNPTRDALQKALSTLENGSYGLCFGSGMAATDTVIRLLNPGDGVISTNDLYGGTYRIFTKVHARYGLRFQFISMANTDLFERSISPVTKMIWIETPTNPLLNIIDIKAFTDIARKKGILTVVDNTFASPYLQNPLDLGADIVLHSVTKYLGGHSDTVMGALITNNQEIYESLKFLQNSCGAVPGPQDCFLVLRGIKTLAVRMRQHCVNAREIAKYLSEHPKVDTVFYPGFESHPNHSIAAKQMKDFGGIVSFTTKGDNLENGLKILSGTKLFTLAESLGGVESLIGHPATMTHASIPREERYANGLKDSLIRLSVGIEDSSDLIADLDLALQKVK